MTQATGSSQATGQSSTSSQSGSQSTQGTGAQSAGSEQPKTGQQTTQTEGGGGGAGGQQQAPVRPAYVPEPFWDATKGEVKGDDFAKAFNDLSAFKAEVDVRKNSLPADPSKYEIKLPSDFKAPEGMQFEIDQADPLWGQARELAHAAGLDQDGFSKFAGIFAAHKLNEVKTVNDARAAETAKLGAAGPARIDAVVTWLNAVGGPEMQVMADTLKKYPVASTVAGFENLIKRMSSQGGGSFSQSHRAGAEPPTVIEGYEKMTFGQIREAQMKLKAGGAGR